MLDKKIEMLKRVAAFLELGRLPKNLNVNSSGKPLRARHRSPRRRLRFKDRVALLVRRQMEEAKSRRRLC